MKLTFLSKFVFAMVHETALLSCYSPSPPPKKEKVPSSEYIHYPDLFPIAVFIHYLQSCVQNFSGKITLKAVAWKTEREIGG
jgi:hypothetical protein